MSTIEKLVGTALLLIALYLVLNQASGASQVLNSLAGFASSTFRTLQGR